MEELQLLLELLPQQRRKGKPLWASPFLLTANRTQKAETVTCREQLTCHMDRGGERVEWICEIGPEPLQTENPLPQRLEISNYRPIPV